MQPFGQEPVLWCLMKLWNNKAVSATGTFFKQSALTVIASTKGKHDLGWMKLTTPGLLIFATSIVFRTQAQEYNPSSGTLTQNMPDSNCSPLNLSGYIEAYYGYDLGQPGNNTRPSFIYAYNRHNEVTVNLAYLQGNYSADRVRAHIALAAGTYMNANYAAEPGVLKNIYEAYAGVRLSHKRRLWLDAGIMPSHIGFESANAQSCRTLTRSMIADNSPYFETGAKLGYESNNSKWYLAALVLNGWQRIQRADGNSTICGGTQVMYLPNDKVTINHSTFIGNDKPDSIAQMRIFNHLHTIIKLAPKLEILLGFDYGMEQQYKGSSTWNNWMGTALQLHYQLTSKIAIAARGEYYQDQKGVIIATGTPNGFMTSGYSLNFDYAIVEHVRWRVEGKMLNSKDAIFSEKGGAMTNNNTVLTTSLSFAF